MATFTAMNFPREGNEDFNRAGYRTVYAPSSNANTFKYAKGFPLAQDTYLYTDDGQPIRKLNKGSHIHFLYPSRLVHNLDLGISRRGTYSAVSTKSHKGRVEGYILISHVIKPAGGAQNRVASGSASQKAVADAVQNIAFEHDYDYKFISMARPGSNAPDLICEVDGHKTQFEIKGAGSDNAPITFFDKSVSRIRKTPKIIDDISKLFATHCKLKLIKKDFVSVIDYFRAENNEFGFPGDDGAPKSGKIPPFFTTTSRPLLLKLHKLILRHFAEGGDNYFVINNRSNNTFKFYYTEYGQNILHLKDLPEFSSFSLATYGGASSGSMRAGLKIKLRD